MKATNSGPLTIKKATFTEPQKVGDETKAYTYAGYALKGWLNGQRVRKQFKTHGEALTAKAKLEIEAANGNGEIHAINTRLNAAQVRLAELAFERLGEHSLPVAVDWFIANYRAPLVSATVENATAESKRDREAEVSMPVVVDYRKVVKLILRVFPGRSLDTITTAELENVMGSWGQSKKSWNNLGTYLHAYFEFCAHASPRWVTTNPIKAIRTALGGTVRMLSSPSAIMPALLMRTSQWPNVFAKWSRKAAVLLSSVTFRGW